MRRHSEVDVSKAVRKLCRWPPSERIRRDLEVAGHEVWIDMAKIKARDDWRRSIVDGLSDTHWILGFLSRQQARRFAEHGLSTLVLETMARLGGA